MNIDHVCAFVVLCKTRKFQEAADQLYISQSALSKHIKALEKELGNPLFNRTSRMVQLTDFGNEFYNIATQIVKLNDDTIRLVNKYSHSVMKLCVGITPDTAEYHYIVHPLIENIKSAADLDVDILQQNYSVLRELMLEANCDIAFFEQPPDTVDILTFNTIHLFDDELALLVANNHPLAEKKEIEISELSNTHFAMLRQDSIFNPLVQSYCKDNGNFVPVNPFYVMQKTFLYECIREGFSVAIHSKAFAQLHLAIRPNNFTIIDLVDSPKLQYNAYYPKSRVLPAEVINVIEDIGESVRNILLTSSTP